LFIQKETHDNVTVEFDSKSQILIKQFRSFNEKEKINELIVEFISEATGTEVYNKEIIDLITEVNAGFKTGAKIDPLNVRILDATKNKKLGNNYITIEKTILSDYRVAVEDGKEYEAREQEYKEFTQKVEKGNAESYILKGLLKEVKVGFQEFLVMRPSDLEKTAAFYLKAIEIDPKNYDAYCLLTKIYKDMGDEQKAAESLRNYRRLKLNHLSDDFYKRRDEILDFYRPSINKYCLNNFCNL
jgi:tetratricopeptide (TPR) repeat protein